MYHLLYKMKMYTLSNLDPHLSNHALDIYVLPHISDTWPSMGLESSFYEKKCVLPLPVGPDMVIVDGC